MASGLILLDAARQIGRLAHAEQVRKGSGEPYFNHLHRVALRVTGWRAQTIAFLHDTVEDTPITGYTLEQLGFPRDIVSDVIALSRGMKIDTDEKGYVRLRDETYFEFIERTIRDGSDDALLVKLADLQDNLNDDSWSPPRDRYIKADLMVRNALLARGADTWLNEVA
jgi:(p)ppGpp synthase/HD superfamily hydrolase